MADLTRVPRDWPHREASRSVRSKSGSRLDWHVQVKGRGPTILLLHGTGSSAHSWADLLEPLAEVATVVAPDLPGHGFTTGASPVTLSLPQIALELDALIAALNVAPVTVVVGHSAGAALALRWALGQQGKPQQQSQQQSQQPLRALIGFNPSLIAPPALYTQLFAPFIVPVATSSWAASLLAALGARTRMVDRLLDATRSRIPAVQRARYARLFNDPAHVRGAMGYMAAADLPAIIESAQALDVPMQFILGARDEWVPEHRLREVITKHFPHAAVQRWQGGHVLHEEQPQAAVRLMIETLNTVLGAVVTEE